MDVQSFVGRARRPRQGEETTGPKALPRRLWLSAATALLAGACVPAGGAGAPEEEEVDLGQARAASTPAGLPPPERFEAWNQELRAEAPGRDVVLVDLDAVDHNIAVVKSQLGQKFALRIVTKSVPSLPLLEYMLEKAQTNRVMAFSEGMLRAMLDHFNHLDVLLGRPMPVEGARRVLKEHPSKGRKVRWLVDTKERMLEYRALANSVPARLDVAIEIDVGLRRGGARTTEELLEMLAIVAASPMRLRFVGLMGYEGHVPFAPPGFDSDTEFAAVTARYADFVQAGKQAHKALFAGPLVLDSGGSGTYYRYSNALQTPVNDIAMGSAFLLPANFGGLAQLGLMPAVFMASPILKRIDPAEVPFAEGYLPMLAQSDPSFENAFFMVAGGFPGNIAYPSGLVKNPVVPEVEGGVQSLLPNQTLRNGSSALPLDVGDFVFYHPWEASSLGWLSTLEALRDDQIVTRWSTFREGCWKGCGAP